MIEIYLDLSRNKSYSSNDNMDKIGWYGLGCYVEIVFLLLYSLNLFVMNMDHFTKKNEVLIFQAQIIWCHLDRILKQSKLIYSYRNKSTFDWVQEWGNYLHVRGELIDDRNFYILTVVVITQVHKFIKIYITLYW